MGIWCRVFDGDGSTVRTTVHWETDSTSFKSESLTVTLDENDIIDVKCWDEDGDNDDSMGWKHIASDKFWLCGMERTSFETSKGTSLEVSVQPVGMEFDGTRITLDRPYWDSFCP